MTVVFSDITGSVPLGEALDPESLRRMMLRYFEEMKLVVERHGGVVEKYIGDAVMAVFGIPQLHEDDALRAVRAAAEMREALADLNEELQRTWGVALATRTGVNTGEVVAGDSELGQMLVTGDAVNVAARLQQSAQPGEVLIGEPTFRLVQAAIVAEQMEPLALKGKAEPVPAWRLLEIVPGAPGLDSPARLAARRPRDGARAAPVGLRADQPSRSACELVTLVGSAGVGKSRLTAEFLSGLGDSATVVSGRCLPYGEGITFWPVAAVIRDAADIEPQDSPDAAAAKTLGAGRRRPGRASSCTTGSRRCWAWGAGRPASRRRSGECESSSSTWRRASRSSSSSTTSTGASRRSSTCSNTSQTGSGRRRILIICLARPELLELRPGWSAVKPNVSQVTVLR